MNKNGNESIFQLDNEGLSRPDILARKQINFKIDHNFNTIHKLSGSYTYENSYGIANFEALPTGFRGNASAGLSFCRCTSLRRSVVESFE